MVLCCSRLLHHCLYVPLFLCLAWRCFQSPRHHFREIVAVWMWNWYLYSICCWLSFMPWLILIRRTIYGTYIDPKCSRRCGWFFPGGCRELKKWTPKSSECATEVYLQPRCNSPMWALSFFSPSPVRRDRPGIQSRGRKIPLKSAFRHPLACFRSHPDGLHNKYSVINSIQTYIYHCGMDAQGGKNRSLCLLPSLSVNSMDVRLCNTWNDFIAVGSSLDLRAFQWLNSAQSRKYIQRTKSVSSCHPLFHTG